MAASDMYVALAPYSPPVAKPCSRRANSRMIAAQMPMLAAVGVMAMMNEQKAISVTDTVNARRRP
ncbi:hypothetical protein D3C81_458900 [compost metagenome]